MDFHCEKLKSLCRICGGKIKANDPGYVHPKKCSDYQDVLTAKSWIRTEDEDPQIYPKNLCNSCKKKLDQIRSGKNIELSFATFQGHDDQCKVCSIQPQRRGKIPVSLHSNKIDKAFQSIGYSKFSAATSRIYYEPLPNENNHVSVGIVVQVDFDGTWKATVNENSVSKADEVFNNVPEKLTDNNLDEFCKELQSITTCKGIKDFQDVISKRLDFRNPFPDSQGGTAAYIESSSSGTRLSKECFDTIRSRNCCFLVSKSNKAQLCNFCNDFRKNLFVYRSRAADAPEQYQSRVSDESKTNFRYLPIVEMEERLKNLAKAKRDAVGMAAKYAVRISKLIEEKGVSVSKEDNNLFANILENNKTDFEDGSPQQLLWQQQLEQSKKCNSKSMRWHPLIIRWCLSIYHTSPAAYRHLASKRNNFLVLPHINTLKKYINFTNPTSGFNQDIITQLCIDSDIENLPEFQRNVSLIFDEIKIKSGLIYKRSTGQLIGFTEMGELNEEISLFQQYISDEEKDREFASYCNVFMVRGICSSLCYPFGYHAGNGFTAAQLFPLVWEATHVLECLGFKVRAWVCDGASPNRKCFKINGEDIYWTWNLFDLSRKIYFISDAPHLIKTTRNNLENSHGNRNSRNLKFDGFDVSWMHIVSVYEWDLGLNRASPGLRRLHKLTEDHIRLTPRHRMKVKFAVNVLSNSVASAIEQQGCFGRTSTVKFLKIFDRAFDCLNVMHLFGDKKADRMPYKDVNDARFEYLESVISFLEKWREEINQVPGLSSDEKKRFCLSQQTDMGWRITIKSFVELCKLLLEQDGVKYILSEKFSQDPLEEHFARHRRSAGCNDNPSLIQFQQQEVALNLIKSPLIGDLRGNTSGRADNRPKLQSSDMRLPRRKEPKQGPANT